MMVTGLAQAGGGYGSATLAAWRAQSVAASERGTGNAGAKQETAADEQKIIDQLAETDRKVRAHEQAHISAGGGLVQGGASFSFQRGPDGKSYAVAGEVRIDTSAGKDATETLSKAARIRAAAMAPADPSPQDRHVAAVASQMEVQARAELATTGAAEQQSAGEVSGRGAQAVAAYKAGSGAAPASGFSAYA